MKCYDCRERTAIHPAVYSIEGAIVRLCQKCWNRWRPFMHVDTCDCPHCVWSRGVIAGEP